MPRQGADPLRLIARLEAALKASKKTDVANSTLMAEITGMHWRNLLVTHIQGDEKFPIRHRGGEGEAWQFEVQKVLRHMIARQREKLNRNAKRNADAARMTGFVVPEESAEALSLADLSRMADLTLRVQQGKERQGGYTPAERTAAIFAGYNEAVRQGILGVGSKVDPAGILPPDIRSAMDEELRSLAVKIGEIATKYLRETGARIEQGGAG